MNTQTPKHPQTHPVVTQHIQTLERYFESQRDYLTHLDNPPDPTDPFAQNTYTVRTAELNQAVERHAEQLSQSVIKLSKIPYTDRYDHHTDRY